LNGNTVSWAEAKRWKTMKNSFDSYALILYKLALLIDARDKQMIAPRQAVTLDTLVTF
jgi:hypothetical protein